MRRYWDTVSGGDGGLYVGLCILYYIWGPTFASDFNKSKTLASWACLLIPLDVAFTVN